jgi:hypothetical protein
MWLQQITYGKPQGLGEQDSNCQRTWHNVVALGLSTVTNSHPELSSGGLIG